MLPLKPNSAYGKIRSSLAWKNCMERFNEDPARHYLSNMNTPYLRRTGHRGMEKTWTGVSEVVTEKKMTLNLGEGFSVAWKHHFRGEPGPYYEDLYDLVCPLQPARTTRDHERQYLKSSLTVGLSIDPRWRAKGDKLQPSFGDSEVRCFSEWCNLSEDKGTVPNFILISDFTRVSNGKILIVPLPLICIKRSHWAVHLSASSCILTIKSLLKYCLAVLILPPVTTGCNVRRHSFSGVLIASSIYLGFLAAEEIEQPFGYDEVYFPAECAIVCD
ncbi:hypothetical protein EV368DRAFT_60454 [Lentinula lateritia]|nr:hypothetical protein EV368DRAFT_60454 [Lentinula lateritia]